MGKSGILGHLDLYHQVQVLWLSFNVFLVGGIEKVQHQQTQMLGV